MRATRFFISLGAGLALGIAVAASARARESREALDGAKWTLNGNTAQATFAVSDLDACGGVCFTPAKGSEYAAFTLNGKPIAGPLPGMIYATIPLDPRSMLVKGENVLAATGLANPLPPPAQCARLVIYPPSAVAIQSGPVLGTAGADFFTVTCRTNLPAEVVVAARPVAAAAKECSSQSPRGFYHRLRIGIPPGTRQFSYSVTCRCGDARQTAGPFTVRVPGTQDKAFRFVALGDCRSNPDRWAAVADAALKRKPELVVFSGDFVGGGLADEHWDVEFFAPAHDLLSTVPFYTVLGNHDKYAPLYYEMFYTASPGGKGDNWAQALHDVLFIGIDGGSNKNWKAGSKNAQWLEGVLKTSKEKFIFFFTHYPAWSSGTHGSTAASRDVILPLLAKYHATALISGHDHLYERSEPPADKGVTCIVSGGSGAPLYQKSRHANNPYSKVLVSTLHYCVFDVSGDACEMKVYGLDGKLLDEKTFPAR